MVCRLECRYGKITGNCTRNYQSVRFVEEFRREKGNTGIVKQNAKTQTGTTTIICNSKQKRCVNLQN